MRVLHILPSYRPRMAARISALARAMPGRDIRFDCLSFDPLPEAFARRIQETGGGVYRMADPRKKGWRAFSTSFRLPLEANNYRAIHCHVTGSMALVFFLLARRYQLPLFLLHAHGRIQEESGRIGEKERKGLLARYRAKLSASWKRKISSALLGSSYRAIQEVYGPGVDYQKILVLPTGIDPALFLKSREEQILLYQALGERLDLGPGLRLGLAGKLGQGKRRDLVQELLAQAKEKGQPLQILLFGGGEEEKSLSNALEKRGLSGKVHGLDRKASLGENLAGLDLLLLPRATEEIPPLLIQGQAANLPVLAVEGISREGDLGLGLVHFFSKELGPGDLWQAVQEALARPHADVLAIRQALEKKNFTLERSADLYQALLEGKTKRFQLD